MLNVGFPNVSAAGSAAFEEFENFLLLVYPIIPNYVLFGATHVCSVFLVGFKALRSAVSSYLPAYTYIFLFAADICLSGK